MFPDFKCDYQLNTKPEELKKRIAEGFTFLYNAGGSQVFSVSRNELIEPDVYEKTRLRSNIRFEGYNGQMFGDNDKGYRTAFIDQDNIPNSSVRNNLNGAGIEDYYEYDNDLKLIYVKLLVGHCFYDLNGRIAVNDAGEIKYYRMQKKLINHGMQSPGYNRLIIVKDEEGQPWLLKMNNMKVLNSYCISNNNKRELSEEENNQLLGEIKLESITGRDKYGHGDYLREEYEEKEKAPEIEVEKVDPDRLYEAYGLMAGNNESGLRVEVQVKVWYKSVVEKDPVFGGTRAYRYPEHFEVLTYRFPSTGNRWIPYSGSITSCGAAFGESYTHNYCIFIGGITFRLFGPDYYDR